MLEILKDLWITLDDGDPWGIETVAVGEYDVQANHKPELNTLTITITGEAYLALERDIEKAIQDEIHKAELERLRSMCSDRCNWRGE